MAAVEMRCSLRILQRKIAAVDMKCSLRILHRKMAAVEMRCSLRILGISYTDHVTNEEIHKAMAQHVGHCGALLATGNSRKRRRYGHVGHCEVLLTTGKEGSDHREGEEAGAVLARGSL